MLRFDSRAYFALAVILAARLRSLQPRQRPAIILLALFPAIFTPVGEALYNLVTQGRQRLAPPQLQSRQY